MAIYFLDSSTVVKHCVPKQGSAWVVGITDPASRNLLYVARITGAEVVSAVTRRQRRSQITPLDSAAALGAFRRDFPSGYLVIEITAPVVAKAMELCAQCRLAGLPELTFVAADNDLNTAAAAEGLTVDDPNNH